MGELQMFDSPDDWLEGAHLHPATMQISGRWASNPFMDRAVPCEDCGTLVSAVSVTGLDENIPTRLCEVSPDPEFPLHGATMKAHTPERCRAARREQVRGSREH